MGRGVHSFYWLTDARETYCNFNLVFNQLKCARSPGICCGNCYLYLQFSGKTEFTWILEDHKAVRNVADKFNCNVIEGNVLEWVAHSNSRNVKSQMAA